MDDELGVALVVAHLKLTAQVEGGRVAEHLFKILSLSFFLPLETWLTLPKVLVWSLTVILCRQLGMGRQLEARGLDISRTIGVSSSSVRVRVKGRLEEQFETEVVEQIKEVVVVYVPGGAVAVTAPAIAVAEAEAGIPCAPGCRGHQQELS